MNKTLVLRQLGNQASKISTSSSSTVTIVPLPVNTSQSCPLHHVQKDGSNSNEQISSSSIIKPYSEVPEPKGLPLIGNYLKFMLSGGGKYLHKYVENRRLSFGPIYKEKYSIEPIKVLFIGDIDGIRDVYRNESNQPDPLVQFPPALYMQKRDIKRGLFFTSGDEWSRLRKPMNNLILKRKDYHQQLYKYFEINLDKQIENWTSISQANPESSIPNVERLISYLGASCFGMLAFGSQSTKHLETIEKDSRNFYDLIFQHNKRNQEMMIFPPKLAMKWNLSIWKDFERALDGLLGIGHTWARLANDDLESIKHQEEKGLLHIMLSEYNYSLTDVQRIFADTMIAMETETTMYNWLAYILGQYPEAQEKIHNEITTTIGTRKLNFGDIEGLKYLNACVKETLRLFPSVPFTVRILPKDSVIKGYQVPAGTIAAMSLWSAQRDPTNFPDPERFWPERWYRGQGKPNDQDPSDDEILSTKNEEGINSRCPLGVQGAQPYMPYAWGTRRGCVFRKISTINMSLIFGRLVQEFQWTTSKVEPIMKILLAPDRDIRLKLRKRN